jgi:hypothetical protein
MSKTRNPQRSGKIPNQHFADIWLGHIPRLPVDQMHEVGIAIEMELLNGLHGQIPAAQDFHLGIQLFTDIFAAAEALHLFETELGRNILRIHLDVGLCREEPLRKVVNERASQESQENCDDHDPGSLLEELSDAPERIFIVEAARRRSTARRNLRDGYGRIGVLIFSYYQINVLEITSSLGVLPEAAKHRTRTFQKNQDLAAETLLLSRKPRYHRELKLTARE